jgi:signal transduction histidine kinase
LLVDTLKELEDASVALGAAGLTPDELSRVRTLRDQSLIPATTGVFSAIERSDREDEMADWLEAHSVDTASAAALAESEVTPEHLDALAETITGPALDVAIRWVAATHTARVLSGDIERAGGRIYRLVSAVKRFTYMDRATVTEPTDVAQGLADTVAVLAGKAKAKGVAVTLDVADNLPMLPAFAGELNQVWSNLLDNAVDAVGPSGRVAVSATQEGEQIAVRFIDDGPGIPADVLSRIFDPFFTTKPLGEGTGLGLDIARRIVRLHQGQIVVDSHPGRTEFRVTVPLRLGS